MVFNEAVRQCNLEGVALPSAKPLRGTALDGAARLLAPPKAPRQLSARHKSDGHVGFTLFHEAADLLRYGKRKVYLDERSGTTKEFEEAAAEWAANCESLGGS